MKYFLVASAVFLASASAYAFEVSEATLNQNVQQRLTEKPGRDVQIRNQKISLLDGFATVCATVHAKALARDVDFCADMTPKWRPESGSLLATRMALVSLNAPGVREKDVELLKVVVNQVVLPRLEGVEVYRADNLIGKQISAVKVLPGRLDISM